MGGEGFSFSSHAAPTGAADAAELTAERRVRGALMCEQLPGDVLLIPELWGHATLNLQPSIGWASEML